MIEPPFPWSLAYVADRLQYDGKDRLRSVRRMCDKLGVPYCRRDGHTLLVTEPRRHQAGAIGRHQGEGSAHAFQPGENAVHQTWRPVALDALGARLDRDRSWLVRRAIDDLVDAQPQPPQERPPGIMGELMAEGIISAGPARKRREKKRRR